MILLVEGGQGLLDRNVCVAAVEERCGAEVFRAIEAVFGQTTTRVKG